MRGDPPHSRCRSSILTVLGCAGKYGNDKGSTLEPLPTDEQLLAWAREKLSM